MSITAGTTVTLDGTGVYIVRPAGALTTGADSNVVAAGGAGEGASCTITNTVFFQGIPTLNQYDMVLLALLMLAFGFVGLRRA